MIHHIKGNLLTSDCDVIIHQSNCQMGFGSGIAGQIRQQYPEAYEAFMADTREPTMKLGFYSDAISNGKHIYNMYSQYNYGRDTRVVYTNYDAIAFGLDQIIPVVIAENPEAKIGLPYLIGCGLANGDWNKVRLILEKASKLHGVDLYLYEYTP